METCTQHGGGEHGDCASGLGQVTCYLREDRDEVGLVPFWGHDHPGGAVQVLFEAQLEGLAHGADDALGEALTALQDVAGCRGLFVTQH